MAETEPHTETPDWKEVLVRLAKAAYEQGYKHGLAAKSARALTNGEPDG